jgi:hypothetical protein
MLPYMVEHVPLCRWSKLGLHQTFTSIFCGAILNYISDIACQPLYKVEPVNKHFSEKENKKVLDKFLQEAYLTYSQVNGADYYKKSIPDKIKKRLDHLSTYRGGNKNFFPKALEDCDDKYFKTQYGMRGIQEKVVLILHEDEVHLLRKESE